MFKFISKLFKKKNKIKKSEIQNLDIAFCEFILTRLIEFRSSIYRHISKYELDDMIFAFSNYLDDPTKYDLNTREGRRMRKGFYTFYRRWMDLWW